MAHIGQEGASCPVGSLGRLLGGNQRRLGGLDLADIAQQEQQTERLAFAIASRHRAAQQEPSPLAVTRLEPALGLEITFLALRLGRHARLERP
ncbi:MAG TPA: hypothetical protein VJ572_12190 [Azonexus sp.]|nr:hypothetical protein [Azonexus sp.]